MPDGRARVNRVRGAAENAVCRFAAWWCDHWVTHTCGWWRFWCHMPSQPWFVHWADRIQERREEAAR